MADLPVAPDWTTWANGGYLPPDGSQIGPAAIDVPGGGAGPSTTLQDVLRRVRGLVGGAQNAVSPLIQRMEGSVPAPAPPQAPPAAAVPPVPAAPQAPSGAGLASVLASLRGSQAPQAAPPPVAPPQAPPVAPQAAPSVAPPVDIQAGRPDLRQGDQGTLNIRRNNPLNIRFAGQPGVSNDGGFAVYPTVQDGYNAATALMGKYADSGINTLSGLISKWAPPTENNTAAYIANVSKATGIAPDAKIDLHNPAITSLITPVMARIESGTGGSGGAPSPMLAATQSQPDNGQGGGAPAPLPMTDPLDFMNRVKGMLPYSNAQTTMPDRLKYLALASGLLSGHSLSEGLGKGLGAMTQMEQADIANKRAANAQAIQLANIGMLGQYRNAMMNAAMGRLQQGQARVDQGAARTGAYVENAGNRYNPALQGQIAAAKTGAVEPAKENAEDIDNMLETGANAPARAMQIQQLQQILPTAGTGPGLAALKRGIANYFGVDLNSIGGPNATSAQLTAAVQSQLRGSGIMGKNMRTQREFNTVMEGLPNMDQNPQVAASVINGLKAFNDFNQQAAQAWLALPQDKRQELRGDQDKFQSWRMGQLQDWRQNVEKNGGIYGMGSPNASAPATASQPAATAPVTGSYNGLKYSFTPG